MGHKFLVLGSWSFDFEFKQVALKKTTETRRAQRTSEKIDLKWIFFFKILNQNNRPDLTHDANLKIRNFNV